MRIDKFVRLLLGLLLLAGIAILYIYREQLDIDAFQTMLDELGIFAPLIFIGLYTIGTVLFLPGSVMTLAGGALFGPWLGTLYNLTGATLGASLAFLLSRYLGADWVQQRASGMLEKILDGVESEGWRFVAFVRLVPLFPFNLLNYVLGLTRIKLLPYVLTTWICMMPGGLAYTWLGHAGSEAAKGSEQTLKNILIAVALLVVVIYSTHLLKKLRNRNDRPEAD